MSLCKHFKTRELAELLGMSDETLKRARDRGELTPVRLGKDLWWAEDEVERWLDSRRERSQVVNLDARRKTRASTTRRYT